MLKEEIENEIDRIKKKTKVLFKVDGVMGNNLEEMTVKSPHSNVKKAYTYMVKAEALRLNALFKESIKYYLSAIMLERDNIQSYIGLAHSYAHLEEDEKAVSTLTKAREVAPTDKNLAFESGVILMNLGLPEMAVERLREAILIDNDNLDAKIQLALAHEMFQEGDFALQIYSSIIESNPSYLKAYQYKAALLMEMEEFSQAARIFAEIISINPNFYKAYIGIGICFDKSGEYRSAIRYYKKYLEMKPHSNHAPDVIARLEKIKKIQSTINSKHNKCDLKIVR